MKVPKHKVRKKSLSSKAAPVSQQLITRIAIRVLKNMNQGNTPAKLPASSPARMLHQPVHAKRAVELKQIKVLILSHHADDSLWRSEQLILEQFRLLCKEATLLRALFHPAVLVEQLAPDLVLGAPEQMPAEWLEQLEAVPVTKAVWLDDSSVHITTPEKLTRVFSYVFTQQVKQKASIVGEADVVVDYLPYAADRLVFNPKAVSEAYCSDLLVIGTAHPEYIHYIQELQQTDELKVYAMGEGWASSQGIIPVDIQDAEREAYYNGAKVIVNLDSFMQRQVFEIAACGAFQLALDHPNLHAFMQPDEDIVTFRSVAELRRKLEYYKNHVEQMRMVESRALWGSTYHYSFLQIVGKLLYKVFHSYNR